MRENNEFDISFNTVDFFKSYWGDGDTAGSLLTMSDTVPNGEAVKATLDKTFNQAENECEAIQVYFRLSAQHTSEYDDNEEECPEHAANSMSKVIITEINGQSLANDGGALCGARQSQAECGNLQRTGIFSRNQIESARKRHATVVLRLYRRRALLREIALSGQCHRAFGEKPDL